MAAGADKMAPSGSEDHSSPTTHIQSRKNLYQWFLNLAVQDNHRMFELVLGDPVAGSGCWEPEPLPPLPVAQRPPHETAFFNSQEPEFCFQILMPPLATSVALDKSLNLSGSVSASVKRCW